MYVQKKYYSLLILCIILLCSCAKKELKPVEYIKWVEDKGNKLFAEKDIDGLLFSIQYQPQDYIVLSQTKDLSIDEQNYKDAKQEIEGLLYFKFSIKDVEKGKSPLYHKVESNNDYQQRVSYLSFNVMNDLKLVMGNDTIPCVLHHFERAYNISPENILSLGFEKPENFIEDECKDDIQFIYKDKIWDMGIVKLVIDSKYIRRIPTLKILTYATEN